MTWAISNLANHRQVRSSALRVDRELNARQPFPWGEGIELCLGPGGADFREPALFHRLGRALVLPDLVVNPESSKLPLLEWIGARLVGSLTLEMLLSICAFHWPQVRAGESGG